MKWVRILGFLLSVGVITLLTHCSSSSPAPSVIDGKWTYTTADGKMKVTFELTSSSTGTLEIKNPASITVNGASGNGAAQISGAAVYALNPGGNSVHALTQQDIAPFLALNAMA